MSIDEVRDEVIYGEFFQVEIPGYGVQNFPTSEYSLDEVIALTDIDEVNMVSGYFAEVADEDEKPQWIGPFDDEDELVEHVADLLGL